MTLLTLGHLLYGESTLTQLAILKRADNSCGRYFMGVLSSEQVEGLLTGLTLNDGSHRPKKEKS